ncbi:hypothetical protein CXB51_031654 [Gossypium anomalum]|uniref:RNase H type-1 domain-containing protein n=1 Tax=Gossypium anomalum TaxID=47600 RepID=A0A8J5YQS6_9ROSI|nr:hypothetical protein CXB51_031654 [Gossypium anomalum]
MTNEELWGILDGLKLILDRRAERVLIQMDSLEVVTTIQDDSAGISNPTLVRRIRQTLLMVKQWKIEYIPWEENTIVDSLQTLSMIKQWKIQHIPWEENKILDSLVKMCTITLEDVQLQLGLSMDGLVVMGSVVVGDWSSICEQLLGKMPLIVYTTLEMHDFDRVIRNFGFRKFVLPPPQDIKALYKVNLQGRTDKDWPKFHDE